MLIAKGATDVALLPQMSNRHGLVAGATGTGKTVSIHAIAEEFSRIGVPVILADVKGDLAGMSQVGGGNPKVEERVKELGLTDWMPAAFPVIFWDVYGEQGHPARSTVSDMGPLLLSRLLDLNDTQSGVLQIVFKYADDRQLLLIDLKDLRAMLQWVGDNRQSLTTEYGLVSAQSIGAVQRALLALEEAGGNALFGEPALALGDLMLTAPDGRGAVNLLAADKLMQSPLAYATFLLWVLAELYEGLPEVGDREKPKLVFFFDEAHLLFEDVPDALRDKVEQVIRLIRSKGVGVFFISQNPLDVPVIVLGQLGNRVQHALRAFTPRDQKAVKAAAETFRVNPEVDVETAITELSVGEALISFLDEKGAPGIVQRAFVLPPVSRIGTITPEERKAVMAASPVSGKYDQGVDRVTAYEMLKEQAAQTAAAAEMEEQASLDAKAAERQAKQAEKEAKERARVDAQMQREMKRDAKRSAQEGELLEDVLGDTARSFGRSFGSSIARGILGSLTRKR
jgi:DNA helicase HerA-like ATPase